MKTVIVFLLGCAVLSTAAVKHGWKTGILVESAETREVAGSRTASGIGDPSQLSANQSITYATLQGFVIRGDDLVWMVQLRIPPATVFRHPKRPNVTIHGPIRYAFEKGKFYIKDEDDAEFELLIMKKAIAPPPEASAK